MKDKLLQAEGEELSRLLGEVLQPDNYDHQPYNLDGTVYECNVCGEQWDEASVVSVDRICHTKCDPFIRLDDWNVAKKYWGWAVAEYDELVCDRAVYDVAWKAQATTKRYMKYRWFSDEAQTKHYLIAAALCKLESEAK
jgi:hypothetical protein